MTRTARTLVLLVTIVGTLFLNGTAHASEEAVTATVEDAAFTHSDGFTFRDAWGDVVALPAGAPLATTPVVCKDRGADVTMLCVAEEAPDGGRIVGWLDNSPVYSDGWVLLVDDGTGAVTWQYRG